MAYIPSPWTGEGQGGGENALQPPPMLPLRLPPSPPSPATASAEGRLIKGGPFPASATAERPQFNGAASPARGEGARSFSVAQVGRLRLVAAGTGALGLGLEVLWTRLFAQVLHNLVL